MTISSKPQRRKLTHEIPSWIKQGAWHFFTINCRVREEAPLIKSGRAAAIMDAACHYDLIGRWYLWLLLVMPDHVHGIATFDLSHGIQKTISSWKGYLAKKHGVAWQSGFFEHRLRTPEEFDEKAGYIRSNPLRKGLVQEASQWPWVLDRDSIEGRANPPGEPESGSAGGLALPGK